MKFLCDQMLSELGRWLRAAGYDTAIAEAGKKDLEILETAAQEKRTLLTCDHEFLEMEAPEKTVIFLKGHSLKEYVEQLSSELHLNWLYRPFSRCLLCNSELVVPDHEAVSKLVPPKIQSQFTEFWYCENCEKVYWEGSHAKHMLEQLNTWQKLS